tara:strand:- start:112159 stop:112281 length:123 start_codon:yes stop_codon:yes gene_type:complete
MEIKRLSAESAGLAARFRAGRDMAPFGLPFLIALRRRRGT